MKFELEVGPVTKQLEAGAAALSDQSRTMREIAEVMDQRVRDTFRNEADPWGSPWQEHAAATTRGRLRAGNYSAQVLVDSTALFTSITPSWDSLSAAVTVGAGTPEAYAAVHQFGLRAGRGAGFTMPQRAFVPIARLGGEADLPDDWWQDVVQPITRMLNEAMEQ